MGTGSTDLARRVRRMPARAAVAALRFRQKYWSSWRPPVCRFTPSCGEYGIVAIDRFGLGRGSWLVVRRLLRCHPFHRGGHDPVPPRTHDPGTTASDRTTTRTRAGAARCHTS